MSEVKTSQPLVSVITPTYNSGLFISKTIESVINQTYHNWEMLLVDDGSTDNTVEIAKRYAKKDERIKIFKLGYNSGRPAVPRNYGIKNSKGKYIAFLDSDDIWLSTKMEEQVLFLEKHPTVGLVHTLAKYMNSPKTKLLNYSQNNFSCIEFNKLLLSSQIVNSTVMLRKEILDYVGLFDESPFLVAMEDYDMLLRVAYYFKIVGIPKILVEYRVHSNNISSSPKTEQFEKFKFVLNKYRKLGWVDDKSAKLSVALFLLRIGRSYMIAGDGKYRTFFLQSWKKCKCSLSFIGLCFALIPPRFSKKIIEFLEELRFNIRILIFTWRQKV